jgi:hypothetical protein
MPDPLSPQEAFSKAGLAWAHDKMKRSVTIMRKLYTGIRTELEDDPQDLQHAGIRRTKNFSIVIPKDQFTNGSHKEGTEVLDDLGVKTQIIRKSEDAIQVTYYCGDLNR